MPRVNDRIDHPSMQAAAAEIKRVSTLPLGPIWLEEARGAVRMAMRAAEEELGAIAGVDGFGEQVIGDAPRLLPRIERLEAGLAGLLVDLWQAKQTVQDGTGGEQLAALARKLQALAENGFALAYESLMETGAGD